MRQRVTHARQTGRHIARGRFAGVAVDRQLVDLNRRPALALARRLVEATFAAADTVLLREGEPAESFYVIVHGTVQIERLGTFVRSIMDGGFIGEVALIEGTGRTATAICATACELLEFGSFEFGRVMSTFPDVRARVEAAAARRPHSEAT
jgi:CRP-like cAMP-binding protein